MKKIHFPILSFLVLLAIISSGFSQTYDKAVEPDMIVKNQNNDKHTAVFIEPNTFSNGGVAELRLGDHFHFIRTQAGTGMMVRDFNDIRFNTGWFSDNQEGHTRLIIKENGRVGIGVDRPAATLQVSGDIALGNNAVNQRFIIHSRTNGKGDFLQITSDVGSSLDKSTWNWGKGITLRRNGHVGIGTTRPQSTLHVNGELSLDENLSLKGSGGSIGQINVKKANKDGYSTLLLQSVASTTHTVMALGTGDNSQGLFWAGYGGKYDAQRNVRIFHNGSVGRIEAGQNGTLVFQAHGGKVGIGTQNPDATLAVRGGIHAQEITVDLEGAITPDYVFEPDYPLPELTAIENYIKKYKHLPEIPSAKEVEENGLELGDMQLKLLKKIEELTLYVIEQEKRLNQLAKENAALMQLIQQHE